MISLTGSRMRRIRSNMTALVLLMAAGFATMMLLPKACSFPLTCPHHHHERYRAKPGVGNDAVTRLAPALHVVAADAGQDDSTNAAKNGSDDMDESERLRRAAEQLRREIAEFQQQKESAKLQAELAEQALLQQQEQEKSRYSAVLPIAKPDGSEVLERIFFRPWFPPKEEQGSTSSTIITCDVGSLPLGVLLGEHLQFVGAIGVDEILQDDGFGAQAGLQVGDIVRACSACRVEMDRPTWQLLAGGIGRPKTRRFMYDVDGRPLEEVMEAIRSNRLDPEQRPILLVVERPSVDAP